MTAQKRQNKRSRRHISSDFRNGSSGVGNFDLALPAAVGKGDELEDVSLGMRGASWHSAKFASTSQPSAQTAARSVILFTFFLYVFCTGRQDVAELRQYSCEAGLGLFSQLH